MKLLVDLILAVLFVGLVGMRKAYASVNVVELKRRARAGDKHAKQAYRAAGYGPTLSLVLNCLAAVTAAFFFYALSQSVGALLFVIISLLFVGLATMWLPASRAGWLSWQLALWLAPVWSWIMNLLHPLLAGLVGRVGKGSVHSGMYEKSDLLNLLRHQADQADNRIDKTELQIAASALKFSDQKIGDVLIPKRGVKSVSADETIGPLVMDELHKSGHSRFPVYEGKKDNIVGILYLRDLVDVKQGGQVKSLMHKRVAYVHEDRPLNDALQACLKTHQQLLVVINEFEEYVGVITLEDVLEQVIGQPIVDEFDQYEDLRAVIERQAKKDHQDHEEPEPSPTESKEDKTSPSDN